MSQRKKIKIVVLDGFTLNPGDLSWERLLKLGECKIFDRTNPSEVIHRAAGAEILLTNKCPVTRDSILRLPNLKFIGVLATGYNIVDVKAAGERGILVSNVPIYGTDSVAQLVFAHILHIIHHIAEHAESVRAGAWSASVDWSYWNHPLQELTGKTMGIIGYGRIGRTVGRLAEAFGMFCLVNDSTDIQRLPEKTQQVNLDELVAKSDFISLHCPLSPDTEKLIDNQRIRKMKPSAILINTSRGPLIDEEALANALNLGLIAAAGLDVLSSEPPHPDNPLLHAKNCYITPHLAWATLEARQRLMTTVVENVKRFLDGNPQNLIPKN